ncbi:MAG: hypothetical protein SFY68_10325 [Candidatus Sumerlaeia bacterium]|nr:hypothetical protein [Candidatus Sumerlaeia bacterium]
MMIDKPRVVTTKLVKRGEDEKEFDRAFWRDAGVQGRFAAAWDMVKEYHLFKGGTLDELRFQRSVAVLKRRKD